jgi:hypothetical protein
MKEDINVFWRASQVYWQKIVPNQVTQNIKGSTNVYFSYCRMHSQILLSKPESGTVKCEQILLHISTFRDWKSVVVWLKEGAIQVCVLNVKLIEKTLHCLLLLMCGIRIMIKCTHLFNR